MQNKRARAIRAASDGACSGNPGPGGWGALIRFEDGSVEEFGGYEQETTNNRMELEAALAIFRKLKDLKRHPNLTIRTDSKYLIDGLSKWIVGWKKKNWRTSSGKKVLNRDLWEKLDAAKLTDVPLEFVKGHNGDPDNERVDKIAVSFSKKLQIDLKSEYMFSNQKEKEENNSQNLYSSISYIERNNMHQLKKLINRLDIADYLAEKGYSLNADEMSMVIGLTNNELDKIKDSQEWRDWNVIRLGSNKLKLEKILKNKIHKNEE